MREFLTKSSVKEIFDKYPYAEDFFHSIGINIKSEIINFNSQISAENKTIEEIIDNLSDYVMEDCSLGKSQIFEHFVSFIEKTEALRVTNLTEVGEITVIGGYDKSGSKDNWTFKIKPGDIVSIVGPTGSGKSRLLADIECLAQKDTPSKRQVLLNGEVPDYDKRFSIDHKLVAQLSQNMNFIMDLSVSEFLIMHAESRMIENSQEVVNSILACANELAGEKFTLDTPVTALSGGQSRALMIADTALLSVSPIVLIDEIENAGVDRKKALDLLVKKGKIVMLSTHDPILALMGHKRIVIRNGAIYKIIETSEIEKKNLINLQKLDLKILQLRDILRTGGEINFDTTEFMKF